MVPSQGIDWTRWQMPIILASVGLLVVAVVMRMKKKPAGAH
jgi:hypothetical protein